MSLLIKRQKPDSKYHDYRTHLGRDRLPACRTPGVELDWRYTGGDVTCKKCIKRAHVDPQTPNLPNL